MEIILSILIGISLSATTGFRLSVPLLVLSGCSIAGWVEVAAEGKMIPAEVSVLSLLDP